eukprot:396277-Rhodomonas_salina.1
MEVVIVLSLLQAKSRSILALALNQDLRDALQRRRCVSSLRIERYAGSTLLTLCPSTDIALAELAEDGKVGLEGDEPKIHPHAPAVRVHSYCPRVGAAVCRDMLHPPAQPEDEVHDAGMLLHFRPSGVLSERQVPLQFSCAKDKPLL